MLLHLSTWQEVEAYLKRSPAVIIPIGSTEQHGPTGLIGTDFICAEAIARAVGEKADALVTSTLTLGMAEHHTGFAGTISLKPSTLNLVIHDVVRSLAKHGFKRFFFLNGHGGNIAVLKNAFTEIANELPDTSFRLGNWWASNEIYKLVKELYGNQEGYHATPSEIAVTMYLYPDSIKNAPLSQSVNKDSRIYSPEEFRQRYPDGRMGSNPALATVEHGKQLFELAVKELVSQYNDFLAEA
ncbi:creatininase family protein [Pseudanabaena sp. 'Roaring Creek']|uniref:creatininase family protein n=1 Tax=Pseudanabaena sp. 'Roaring Creek' TaxID=1681830 RepID=UPI0006D7FFB4|nr:creatininase family protein [Pseudanabaena sp. 'Roaring Creek']